MSKNFENDEELLQFVSDGLVSSTHAQGYSWFWEKFMPALKKAAISKIVEPELIADCYYVAGDVHDFNDAPLAAIKCYKKALEFYPDMNSAHREIANMYDRVGEYDKAIYHSDKALALDPDEKFAVSDRERFSREMSPSANQPFEYRNLIWDAYERLAEQNPAAVIDMLKNRRGVDVWRTLTYCYGALRDNKKYLATWRKLAAKLENIDFTYADWFFMDDDIYHEAEIWKIWLNSKAQFSGCFTDFDGLSESKLYESHSTHKKIKLTLEYYVYAQSSDETGLRRLYKLYPEWEELRDLLSEDLQKVKN